MHFLDWNMNSTRKNGSPGKYLCNDKIYTLPQYTELDLEIRKQCTYIYNRYLKLITEGGAETWMARYFNQGVTVTYPEYTTRYEILNALLGVDMVNEMFLVSNHYMRLYDFLVIEHNVPKEKLDTLWKYLSMDNLMNENRVYFIDTCIEIYEKIYNKKWQEDKIFAYFMVNYLKDFIPINYLYDSPNIQAYKDYYYNHYLKVNHSITETIENGKYTLYGQPKIMYYNGNYQLVFYVEYKENNQRKYGNLTIHYDFENNKVIRYQFKKDPEITSVNP